jgi:hypothetical protein
MGPGDKRRDDIDRRRDDFSIAASVAWHDGSREQVAR